MTGRILASWFLLVGAVPAQEPAPPESLSKDRILQLIEQLADEDVQRRDEATIELQRAGMKVHQELEEASHSSNPERAGRADRLLGILNRMRISIQVPNLERVPKGKPIPAELRILHPTSEGGFYFREGFTLTVWLLELQEEPPQEGRLVHGTSNARAANGCALSTFDFIRLTPANEHVESIEDLRTRWEFEIAEKVLEKYPKISLEAPTLAGRYRLVATYGYDRAKYLELCSKGCREHSDPRAPWNRAIKTLPQAELEFVIR
ncbi:MAG TPA: hypothetical protein VEN81_07935 [Planctomycetota bacterium]|nr:hypothetical protein [Planctomycetota bacterium]